MAKWNLRVEQSNHDKFSDSIPARVFDWHGVRRELVRKLWFPAIEQDASQSISIARIDL